MTERTKQNPLDEREEEVLRGLFHDAMVREGQAFSDTNDAEKEALPQIPAELDAKCRKLIRESGGKQRKVQFLKNSGFGLGNAAIITLVCLLLISMTAAKVDAIRIPVLNFLTDKDGRYSKIQSYEHKLDQGALLNEKILSAPLPEGYELVDMWNYEDGTFGAWFENDESLTICVNFFPSDHIINYDVEQAEQIKTKILNHDAILIKKQGLRIIWMDEEYNGIFDVNADGLGEDIFWEYALYLAEL